MLGGEKLVYLSRPYNCKYVLHLSSYHHHFHTYTVHLYLAMGGIENPSQQIQKEKVTDVIPYFRAKKVITPSPVGTHL